MTSYFPTPSPAFLPTSPFQTSVQQVHLQIPVEHQEVLAQLCHVLSPDAWFRAELCVETGAFPMQRVLQGHEGKGSAEIARSSNEVMLLSDEKSNETRMLLSMS